MNALFSVSRVYGISKSLLLLHLQVHVLLQLAIYWHIEPDLCANMAIRQKGEAFPPIATTTNTMRPDSNGDVAGARRRRKSSNLGGDPRGDTGAGGLATRHNEISNTVTTNVCS